ncbi:MAG TPA: 2-oxo acid dehydrogenase subunit E2 [Chthoniobacterales bacterium]
MPQIPIIMPQLGESIAEATVVNIRATAGQTVGSDDEILDVETNKAVMGVTVPCSGSIHHLDVEIGQSYPVGAILGTLEVSIEDAERHGGDFAAPKTNGESVTKAPSHAHAVVPISQSREVAPTVRGLPVPAKTKGASFISPRMKARMLELGLRAADLSGIPGSGSGGRVTVDDLERYLVSLEKNRVTPASRMRIAVADAMRRSWTRPLANVGIYLNLDPLLAHRKKQDPKPGPTLYAIRALALALAENDVAAGRLVGANIVHPSSIDIGFAVEAEDGVIVPVIREVDKTPLAKLVPEYDRLVGLARARRLPPDTFENSAATVTNFGTFGLIWATPIPLPEQSLLLGLGAGRKAPRWDDEIEDFLPVTEAALTLSFDHRVIDGGAAGKLLTQIATLMTQPESL